MRQIFIWVSVVLIAQAACAQNEPDVDALVKRGFEQIRLKEHHQKALQDFEQVIKHSPAYIDAYIGKAIILKQQGQWQQAKEALIAGQQAIKGDQKANLYLAESAWEQGFYDLARSLDRDFTPPDNRKLMDYTDEVVLNYGYDWIDNRPNWWELNFAYKHRLRPDRSFLIYYSDFKRAQDNDFLIGAGYVYHWDHRTTLSVDAYFSDDSGFTADKKYRPRIYRRMPHDFTLGMGANFDDFSDQWAKVSHTEIIKYIQDYFVKYTILLGKDNFDQKVTTHVGEAGYEKENDYSLRLGYSSGNESIERVDRFIDSSVVVDSYFLSGKYFISPDWGLNVSLTREYRDDNFFRVSGSTSLFYRF